MAVHLNWAMRRMVSMICDILLNKFDCFVVIEGNRGLGKSTMAHHIAKKVRGEMKKRGIKDDYKFNVRNTMLYSREEVIKFLNKRQTTGIADEMINVTFNRDFYAEDQKDIIKMVNMNRDHNNLFIACVPSFQTLDSQIKNLCKLRFTVVRRGLAVFQTPNQTIYGRDKWDQAVNEKIEREWIAKGIKKPKYSRLTTFRGFIKFPALSDKDELKYQTVKDDKRSKLYEDKHGEEIEEKDPLTQTINELIDGKIRNKHVLDGVAFGMGLTPDALKKKMRTKLNAQNKSQKIHEYFWENKEAKLRKRSAVIDVLGRK